MTAEIKKEKVYCGGDHENVILEAISRQNIESMLSLKHNLHYYLKSSRTNTDGTKCQMLKRVLTVLESHMALSYYKHESTGIQPQ